MKRRCIGYGEFDGTCTNAAGTRWSPYWCERCNALRLETITKSLNDLVDGKHRERS